MEEIGGYAILARNEDCVVPFGPDTGNAGGRLESLFTSELTLFSALDQAISIASNLTCFRGLQVWCVVELEFIIAQTEFEIEAMRYQQELVVIAETDSWCLLGQPKPACPYLGHISGSDFLSNGFEGFETLDDALHTAFQVRRQAQSSARVAVCTIKPVITYTP